MTHIRKRIRYLAMPAVLFILLAMMVTPVNACYECPPPPDCEVGCTRTLGYWKTHSMYGPAPYDSTWAGMEDIPFYLSGKTIYEALWTAPQGNAYYILAPQFIAARMNIFAGASAPAEVSTAIYWAFDFFNTYAPGDTISKDLRKQVIYYAGILDQYNNGLIGPGHCPD